jgi:hypothetical protein
MQKWEYKIFASHLDPAELVVILDECGREGWELVALAAVADYLPAEIIKAEAMTQAPDDEGDLDEAVHVEAFRYIFKRPLA